MDKVFRYWEKENSSVKKILPALCLGGTRIDVVIECADRDVICRLINKNYIYLEFKSPRSAKIKKFYILIYNNSYYSKILSII